MQVYNIMGSYQAPKSCYFIRAIPDSNASRVFNIMNFFFDCILLYCGWIILILQQKMMQIVTQCDISEIKNLVLLREYQGNAAKLCTWAGVCGQVVSVLPFCSNDPSQNPAEVYNFLLIFLKEKRPGLVHFQQNRAPILAKYVLSNEYQQKVYNIKSGSGAQLVEWSFPTQEVRSWNPVNGNHLFVYFQLH